MLERRRKGDAALAEELKHSCQRRVPSWRKREMGGGWLSAGKLWRESVWSEGQPMLERRRKGRRSSWLRS